MSAKRESDSKARGEGVQRDPQDLLKALVGIPDMEKLADLIEQSKAKGRLTADELDVLDEMELDSDQLDLVYDLMASIGIDTGEGNDVDPEIADSESTSPGCWADCADREDPGGGADPDSFEEDAFGASAAAPDDEESGDVSFGWAYDLLEPEETEDEEENEDNDEERSSSGAKKGSKASDKGIDPLQAYFHDIEQFDQHRLSSDEEKALAQAISNGALAARQLEELREADCLDAKTEAELKEKVRKGRMAREQMIEANLRLVSYVVKRYEGRGMDTPDLIQEGNLGLIEAVDKFDPSKGNKFSTFAVPCIEGHVKKALTNKSRTIRIPGHKLTTIRKIKQTTQRLALELSREPTHEEIAAAMDMPVKKLRQILAEAGRQTIASLDARIGEEEGGDSYDIVPNESSLEPGKAVGSALLKERLAEALGTLGTREEMVLRLLFGFENDRVYSVAEVAGKLHITEARVKQIKVDAMAELNRHKKELKGFLDQTR